MRFSRKSLVLVIFALAFIRSAAAVEPAAESPLVAKGRYVARLGDCVACHTAPKGPQMAGGLELKTPMGSLYSTNITPDPETGIGKYTFAQFDRAMRKGIAADGHNLYPAMPYPSYAKMTEADMRALFEYLTKGVAPVRLPNKAAQMKWPFSMRWGLSLWNKAFLQPEPFKPDPAKSAVLNRGAYLVQGLGHCGACHTPRGFAFQEKAMSELGANGERFLAGETVESWRAINLRNLWTVQDTVQLLKTGRNRFATVSGNMVEVIHNSTQHFSDEDLVAVASYLKSLPAERGERPQPPSVLASRPPVPAVPTDLFTSRGGLGYTQFCVDCHRVDGGGVTNIFPPLAGNPAVTSADPTTLIHVILTGWQTAETKSHPRIFTMPGFARLGDQELAEIVSFTRRSWGNQLVPVTAGQVRKLRAELKADGKNSTKFETPRLAELLAAPNSAQLVRGMRLHLETKKLLPNNVGNQLNCTSCHLNAGTVADGSPFVGVSAFFPSYAPRAGKVITLEERINGCFKRSMNGKPLPLDSADMKAMVAYFDWMKRETRPGDKVAGRGVGKVDPSIKPNVVNGKKVYAQQCAVCHGANGEGIKRDDGAPLYPPLWGDQSFNVGAGMARTYTAAAFVKRNMPISFHANFPLGQGGLSDQDAVDVSEYFTHQPRPDFADKLKDWPKDKKPGDARY